MIAGYTSNTLRLYSAHSSSRARLSRAVRYLHSIPLSANLNGVAGASSSTVNADEIAHFSRLSSLWWDERGEFGMLHKMNPVRMQFVKEKLVSRDRVFCRELS